MKYKKGALNTNADALSRINSLTEEERVPEKNANASQMRKLKPLFCTSVMIRR
jgi:hypothetical protein